MSDRMGRREFLVEGSRAALNVSLLPLAPRSRGNQQAAKSREGTAWKTLIADLEKQIPQLMEEAMVPGLSIAIIKDAKLLWRRGFGVKTERRKNLLIATPCLKLRRRASRCLPIRSCLRNWSSSVYLELLPAFQPYSITFS
jgi:hypothetical protein